MVQIKYIFLLYFINFVESRTQSVCPSLTKNYNNNCKKSLEYFRSDLNSNFWWDYLTIKKSKQSFWERCHSATHCFTWDIFEENDDLFKLPFENVLNGIEFIIIDFIQFYIEYVSTFFNILWKWRLFRFFINPASIFALSTYMFHQKMFMPLIRNLQKQLEQDDNLEFFSRREIEKGTQQLTKTEVEDE